MTAYGLDGGSPVHLGSASADDGAVRLEDLTVDGGDLLLTVAGTGVGHYLLDVLVRPAP